ncbi:MAG: hypothetical protein M3Y18_02900, partial [Candidatus Eremiobacteraeota bacterium]|nr:hypothetical protein [Candidatus Eremiobacteraeota bacterium]
MRTWIVVATLAAACFQATPAWAGISVAGGGYSSSSPAATGAAVLISSGASIPAVPLEVQATLLAPLAGRGGYALTGEIRGFTGGGLGGAYIGAGAGIGTLSRDHTAGPVFTAFAGKSIAPFTSIELRAYRATRTGGATAGFIG